MATLLIGANLPDIDVLAIPFGEELTFRRGWTHGVLAMVALPILLTALMLLWDRTVRRPRDAAAEPAEPRQILLLATLSVLSHPFLDWLNVYGLRWLMPFDGRWFYGDTLFIVDPWIWAMLLGGVLLARRSTRTPWGGRTMAAASVYIAAMLGLALAAPSMVEGGLLRAGLRADEVMVAPVPVNPVARDVVIRRDDIYFRGRLTWLPRPRLVVDDRIVRRNADHPIVAQVAGNERVRDFLSWSRFPFFQVERFGPGYRVVLDDLRYSDGSSPSWAAVELYLNGDGSGDGTVTAMLGHDALPSEPPRRETGRGLLP